MNNALEENTGTTIKVRFSELPPEHGKLAMIPREALYPTLFVVPITVLIVSLVTPLWLTLIILIPFFVLGFFVYRFITRYLEENNSHYEEGFFEPIIQSFEEDGYKINRHQIAYLWNYHEVRLTPMRKVVIEHDWASQATFIVTG